MTYIFDFDGTIVDSMPTFAAAMLSILDEHGVSYPDDIIKIITPLGYKGTASYVVNELGLNATEEEFIKGATEFAYVRYRDEIPLKAGVREKLSELKAKGHSLNVLTASPHIVLEVCLKRLGVYEFFDNVWSCDDFSCTKAETKIYDMAAKRLGVENGGCIFVDDNVNAVATAKAAGMIAIGIFDESSAEYEEEFKKIADRYIHGFSEL